METDEREWTEWNWRTEGDIMVNGAFFVPSGGGLSTQYAKASSVDPKSAAFIQQLTMNAGALYGPRYIDYILFFIIITELRLPPHSLSLSSSLGVCCLFPLPKQLAVLCFCAAFVMGQVGGGGAQLIYKWGFIFIFQIKTKT